MKKLLVFIFVFLFNLISFAQNVDTVITTDIYKSYFCYQYKEPLYVSYVLYKGGGDCSRSGFKFINDTDIDMAKKSDYTASGYDQGHLANAEDFADSCLLDEMTFRFYNCLPQTPNLNRGVWKKWETKIRKESHSDSLMVICGGTFSNKSKKIGNGVYVPDYCWKIVISLKQHKILYVLLFTNKMSNSTVKEVTIENLEKRTKYEIVLPDGY